MSTSDLLRGSPAAPRRRIVGGYATIVFLGLAATILTNNVLPPNPIGPVLFELGLPFLLFYGPGLVAAVGAYLECSVGTCLSVGLIPAVFFAGIAVGGSFLGIPGVGGGDAPLWAITFAFAMVALVAAGAGFLAGSAGHLVVTTVHRVRRRG